MTATWEDGPRNALPATTQMHEQKLGCTSMDRRTFLLSTTAASLANCRSSTTRAGQRRRVPVVDTHLHCFAGMEDARFPYHADAPYRPAAPATPEHLLACMAEAGVDYAVVVHPEPYQDDHSYLEHCLDVGAGKLKGTCLFFADRRNARERMADLIRRRPHQIVAARIHAYAPDRLPPFGTKELRDFWRAVGDLGLAVQLHFEPRYAPGFEPLIREFRDTRVIIDHLGRPFQGTTKDHQRVVQWARHPNTVMKLSSLPPKDQYPHRDIGPVIRKLTDAFGPERLIYGGGFSAEATGASYRAYRERLLSYLTHLSETDRDLVVGGNAARMFGFAEVRM